jgi:predicted ATPase/DNA-binding CsgD family transcriptional regulator
MASSNLPVQLTSFIGRQRELAEIERLLATSRLVTLTGAGGCGKTRLAIQLANTVSGRFADGVWLADLAPLREPELVPQLAVQAVGLRSDSNQPLLELLLDFLRPKQLLLILDNCEHLIAACAELAQPLLSHAPNLRILAASRAPLAMAGETVYPVHGLAWPDGKGGRDRPGHQEVQALMAYDAVRLFVERARAIAPYFTLTADNTAAIAELCWKLDGLPLAIELASARVNVLTAQQIAARLADRFNLLTARPGTGLESRHQTLRAAVDWSYALLTAEEQILLRRLAVFQAGCTLDTAEAVCSGKGVAEGRTLDLLSSLVDKSFVIAETTGRAQARYRLLETIREYALEKLDESGETARLCDRHLDLFVTQTEEIESKLRGAYQQLWMNWLEDELDNLRAALNWSLESRHVEAGLRIANAISEFWWFYGYQREGRAWFERLLSQATDDVPILLRAEANSIVTQFSWQMGDHAVSMAQAKTAIAMVEQIGDDGRFTQGFSLLSLSNNLRATGHYAEAFEVGQRCIQLMREGGYGLAEPLAIQGINAIALEKYDLGRDLLNEALLLTRSQGNTHRVAGILKTLGDLTRSQEGHAEARPFYEESLSIYRELDTASDIASVLCALAHTHLYLGEIERANVLLNESLAMQRAAGNERGMAECLLGFGVLATICGMPVQAVRLLTAAVTWAAESILNTYPGERLAYEQSLAAAQAELTEQAYIEAQREGSKLTIAQAIDLALSLPFTAERVLLEKHERLDALTSREREVTTLIAQGKSNSDIATELVLSKRTVEKHVGNILAKLGFERREQIVRWAIENQIT